MPDPIKPTAADTYPKPEHGWTCFHCGETFTTPGSARDHFGFEPSADPACRIKIGTERGLVMALRKAELELSDAWGLIHNEGTEAAKAYFAQTTRHRAQIMAAEEAGYERGLADAAQQAREQGRQEGREQALEEAAVAMENLCFFTDIEELREMTKQDLSVRTCHKGAEAIRALKEQPPC